MASTPQKTENAVPPVSVESLKIRNFRNLQRLDIELPAAGVVILGPNGAGKTNLVEAIYYLEIFRSFRGVRDRDLIRFGEDVFRVEAVTPESSGQTEIAAAYQRTTRRKKVEVEGAEAGRLVDALGRLGAVVFSLDDAEIVAGSPGGRRRFLDILLSRVRPGYVANLQRYRAVLSQRNEALRSGASSAAVEAWTAGLVEPAARVMAERDRWIGRVSAEFSRYHAEIAGGGAGVLRYEPGLAGLNADHASKSAPSKSAPSESAASDAAAGEAPREPGAAPPGGGEEMWAAWLREGLDRTAERERRHGATQVGPHRDDLAILAAVDSTQELRDLRRFGSGGQRRTAAIGLRLLEADSVAEHSGRDALYLLDDVFAELDRERSERVVSLLDTNRSGQIVMTAPKSADMPLRGGNLSQWRILNGEVHAA
ncbi:MAG: DNA replication and repair protein RecF [Gemmatimonadota bacterium]